MVAHLGDDLHGLPQPLARIGVARRGLAPRLDVVALERLERFLEQVVIEETRGARAPLHRLVQCQLVGHHGEAPSRSIELRTTLSCLVTI